MYNYEKVQGIYDYYKDILSKTKKPDNADKWDYEYSPQKEGYEHFIEMTTKEMNYAKNMLVKYRKKFPEEFI
jgi:hypothetical protein